MTHTESDAARNAWVDLPEVCDEHRPFGYHVSLVNVILCAPMHKIYPPRELADMGTLENCVMIIY